MPFQILEGIWRGPVGIPQIREQTGTQGQCPFVKLSCLGQGKRKLSDLQLFSLSVLKHSWHCSLWSLSEPVCFPSASSSLGITLENTVSGLWRSHSSWEEGLCLFGALLLGLVLRPGLHSAVQCRLVTRGGFKLRWVIMPLGFSHYPSVWAQAKV